MGATNTTTNLSLSQFINTDMPAWRSDYNGDMLKIDNAYAADISGADTAAEIASGDYIKMYDISASKNTKVTISDLSSALQGNTDLSELNDVTITTPTDGQSLKYDADSSKWVNGDMEASSVSYDNTTSGLTADDVQEAIDEIDSNLDTLDGKVYKTDDSTETTIASDDLLPIYDTSATASKKITVANVVKDTVSNPNLIDNPWFTVNQRGSNNYTADGYCVDRWYELNADVAVSDSGITLTKRSGAQYDPLVRQLIIPTKDLRGKTVTLSISVTAITANGGLNLYKASGINNDLVSIGGISFATTGKYTITASIPNDVGGSTYPYLLIGIDSYGTDCSLSVESVKLELGSISTLALDTAPNYATELLKCQRYYYKIEPIYTYQTPYICVGVDTTYGTGFSFPTEMRIAPAISNISLTSFFGGSTITGVSANKTKQGIVNFYKNNSLVSGERYYVIFEASADL